MWETAEHNGEPLLVTYDGATLRLINLSNKKTLNSIEYHMMGVFSERLHITAKIHGYKQLFFFIFKQRFLKVFDMNLVEISSFSFDVGMAVIAMHWITEENNLYLTGTNGLLVCFHLETQHKVTEFVVNWIKVFEVHSTEEWIVSLTHDVFTGLLYGVAGTALYAWDLKTGIFNFRLPDLHDKFRLCHVNVLVESHIIVTSGLDGYIKFWNIQYPVFKLYSEIQVSKEGYTSFAIKDRSIFSIGADREIKYFVVGSDVPKCSINLTDQTHPPKYDEVVLADIRTLNCSDKLKDRLFVTVYKNIVTVVSLGFCSDNFMTANFPISLMDYNENSRKLFCICTNNMVVYNDSIYDLDAMSCPYAKRSPVSDALCLCSNGNSIFVGLKNGCLKILNNETMDGIMLETDDIDDSIIRVLACTNMFNQNHPNCLGESNSVNRGQEYIIGATVRGKVHVWCTKCKNRIIYQNLNKRYITDIKVMLNHNLFIVLLKNSLCVYYNTGRAFKLIGQMNSSGKQEYICMDVNEDFTIVICTTVGEVIICSIDVGMEHGDVQFNIEHNIVDLPNQAMDIIFVKEKDIIVSCYSNGYIYTIQASNGLIVRSEFFSDESPLTKAHLKYIPQKEELRCYLSFGIYIHQIFVDISIPDEEISLEENETLEDNISIHQEEESDVDVDDINLSESSSENLSKLIKEMENDNKASIVRKKRIYKEVDKSFVQPLPPPKTKVTLEQAIAKNTEKLSKIFTEDSLYMTPSNGTSLLNMTSVRAKSSTTKMSKVPVFRETKGVDLTLTNFDYSNVQKPKSISQLKQSMTHKESVITTPEATQRTEKMEDFILVEKNILFNDIPIIPCETKRHKNESKFYLTQAGTFMMVKEHKQYVPPISISSMKKAYISPPKTSRILFDDAKTLNALPFYDPRGFSAVYETYEEREARKLVTKQVTSSPNGSNELTATEQAIIQEVTREQAAIKSVRSPYERKHYSSIRDGDTKLELKRPHSTQSTKKTNLYNIIKKESKVLQESREHKVQENMPTKTDETVESPSIPIDQLTSGSNPSFDFYENNKDSIQEHLDDNIIENNNETNENHVKHNDDNDSSGELYMSEENDYYKYMDNQEEESEINNSDLKSLRGLSSISNKSIQSASSAESKIPKSLTILSSPKVKIDTRTTKRISNNIDKADKKEHMANSYHRSEDNRHDHNDSRPKEIRRESTIVNNNSSNTSSSSLIRRPSIIISNIAVPRKENNKESEHKTISTKDTAHKRNIKDRSNRVNRKPKIEFEGTDHPKSDEINIYIKHDINADVPKTMKSSVVLPKKISGNLMKKKTKPAVIKKSDNKTIIKASRVPESYAKEISANKSSLAQQPSEHIDTTSTHETSNTTSSFLSLLYGLPSESLPSLSVTSSHKSKQAPKIYTRHELMMKVRQWTSGDLFDPNEEDNNKKDASDDSLGDSGLDTDILVFKPNLKPYWEQKHIYPIAPIEGIKTIPPRQYTLDLRCMDELHPDVTEKRLVQPNILTIFEQIYAFQTGLSDDMKLTPIYDEFSIYMKGQRIRKYTDHNIV